MVRKNLRRASLAALAVAAVVLAGCAPAADDGGNASSDGTDAYPIGLAVALTGPTASNVVAYRDAAQLAVDEINSAGGIDGVPLELHVEDSQGTADGGIAAMNKLINLYKVPMAIVPGSGPALASQPLAERSDVLLICTGSVSPELLNLPSLYLNAVNMKRLVPSLADSLWEQGHRDLAYLVSADPFGEGAAAQLKPYWESLGGSIVAEQTFDAAVGGDLSAQLLQIKSAKPDALFTVAAGEPLGNAVKQARANGIDVPMAGPMATQRLLSVAGPDAEGFMDIGMTIDEDLDAPLAVSFRDGITALGNVEPDWDSGSTYEVVYLYKQLIETAIDQGLDPQDGSVMSDLVAEQKFTNVLQESDVSFLEDHSVMRPVALRKVVDGEFVVQETILPSE